MFLTRQKCCGKAQIPFVQAQNVSICRVDNATHTSHENMIHIYIYCLLGGWRAGTSYRFNIKHCPSTGLIHVKLYEENTLLHDIDISDTSSRGLNGGRVGVWCNSQEKITWSFLRYR